MSVDAKGTDTFACPTTGTRETDSLACAGGHIRQVGTITVAIPVTHVTPTVGTANLFRVVGPGSRYHRERSTGMPRPGRARTV